MDLRDIFRYIAFELQSLGNASAQLDRIETAIKGLLDGVLEFSIQTGFLFAV